MTMLEEYAINRAEYDPNAPDELPGRCQACGELAILELVDDGVDGIRLCEDCAKEVRRLNAISK